MRGGHAGVGRRCIAAPVIAPKRRNGCVVNEAQAPGDVVEVEEEFNQDPAGDLEPL
jgi:hypothetical protein